MINVTITNRSKIQLRFPVNSWIDGRVKKAGGKFNIRYDCWILNPTPEAIAFLNTEPNICIDAESLERLEVIVDRLLTEQQIAEARYAMSTLPAFEPMDELQQICKLKVRSCQWVPVYYASTFGPNFLLADDMRVGKTLASLLITNLPEHKDLPVLITCPATVIGTWQEAIRDAFGCEAQVLTTQLKAVNKRTRYYICSYEGMQKQIDHNWFFIFDESHKLKNSATKRFKAAKLLTKNATRLLCLTGTPVQNRPKEAYPQLALIANARANAHQLDSKLMSKYDFQNKFCSGGWSPFGRTDNGSSNESEFHKYLRERWMIHRLKEQVFDQLPARSRQTIQISKKKLPACESVFETFSTCAKLKSQDPDFLSWVTDCLDQNEKVIFFAHHQSMIDALIELCKYRNESYIVIDGSVSQDQRTINISNFQNNPNVKAAILSITTASDGICLSASSVCVLCELYWFPGAIEQAENRTFDPDKLKGDISYYPIVFDFEYEVQKMLLDKLVSIKQIIDGLSINDFDSKKSLVNEIASRFGIQTGFRAFKAKNKLSSTTIDTVLSGEIK